MLIAEFVLKHTTHTHLTQADTKTNTLQGTNKNPMNIHNIHSVHYVEMEIIKLKQQGLKTELMIFCYSIIFYLPPKPVKSTIKKIKQSISPVQTNQLSYEKESFRR